MYISESEVRAVLNYPALIPAIRAALADYSAGWSSSRRGPFCEPEMLKVS